MEPRTGSRAQLVASCCALWQQLAARTDARVLMRVRVFSFSFVCTPYGCWVAGVGHPVSQNVKVVLSQNGVHGADLHTILVQYAPPESLKNAHIAGLCWPKPPGFFANQATVDLRVLETAL